MSRFDWMQATDLFVSRAGATTIFEFLALNKPSVLVPLTRGSRGDQVLNAASFEKQGYAKKLDESALTEQTFLSAIDEVFKNRAKYAENLKKANVTESAETIGRIIVGLASKK